MTDTNERAGQNRAGAARLGAFALAILGTLFLLYAAILALHSSFSHWGLAKASGQVVRVVTAGHEGRTAPVVAFADAGGKSHTVMMAQAPRAAQYAAGDTVDVLYDAREPSQASLTGFTQTFAFPLLLASAGALLLLVAATMTEPPEALRLMSQRQAPAVTDASLLQFHPFNAVAVKHYLAEAGAPDGKRKVKITDAAQALGQGRVPTSLAELLGYAAALAYRSDGAQYLATHCPRATKVAEFESDGARALAFLFERHAVIAISETETSRPLAQLRQLFEPRAGAREYVPEETVWDASPRSRAPARAWEQLRGQIERWVKDAAPDHALRDDSAEAVPFILTGHGMGGAMAVLAAYEFAKRGRPVAAVVTFGAPAAGARAFGQEYAELGLDARTLDVSVKSAALPPVRWPLSGSTPALRWQLAPLGVADAACVGVQGGSFLARLAHRLLLREEARGLADKRSLPMGMVLRVLAASRAARIAMLRHDVERRYALPMTALVQQRLHELLGGELGAGAAEQALSDHLLDIRGVRRQDARQAFLTLDGLPAPLAPAPASGPAV